MCVRSYPPRKFEVDILTPATAESAVCAPWAPGARHALYTGHTSGARPNRNTRFTVRDTRDRNSR